MMAIDDDGCFASHLDEVVGGALMPHARARPASEQAHEADALGKGERDVGADGRVPASAAGAARAGGERAVPLSSGDAARFVQAYGTPSLSGLRARQVSFSGTRTPSRETTSISFTLHRARSKCCLGYLGSALSSGSVMGIQSGSPVSLGTGPVRQSRGIAPKYGAPFVAPYESSTTSPSEPGGWSPAGGGDVVESRRGVRQRRRTRRRRGSGRRRRRR